MKPNQSKLKPRDLYNPIKPQWLNFSTTKELPPENGLIGQERAHQAVELGLAIPTRGYNIFAAGEPGSGKTSTLKRILAARAAKEPVAGDLCYVYNFEHPDRPKALLLPAGGGRQLAREMERLVRALKRMIPRVLLEGAFGHIRAGIVAETRADADELTEQASQVASDLGLVLKESENAIHVMPLYRGKPISEEEMESLPTKTRRRMEKKIIEFQEKAESFAYARRQLELEHDERIREAERRAVSPLIEELIEKIMANSKVLGKQVADYLAQVKAHSIDQYHLFTPSDGDGDGSPEMAMIQGLTESQSSNQDPEVLYKVNVLIDRSQQKGAPVVVEQMPTVSALCGSFEYRETPGGLLTDHTLIRPGALHEANGGYLLIQAQELLSHENAWNSLKRSLRHKEIRIDEGLNGGERPKLVGTLKPETIPLNVKVVLVGSHEIYYLLSQGDENFSRLFKILADFEHSMPLNKDNVLRLARFTGQVCREEGYLPIHRSGVARIIEFAARCANNKDRLITKRAAILDLLAESNVFANANGARAIRKKDVEQAIAAKEHRHGSISKAVSREIDKGGIIINTDGEMVGQINGIAVYDVGGFAFGTPVRITSRTYVGRRGVINIDREVNLSGAIHDKGALILIGYLGGRYALENPLGFSASITFEQSYDEIDGDSASSAELYALLSSLSGCRIHQGIAVTGSVNQLGEIQPIGGVNEKIEGVFNVCRRRGLTGSQGVMIPRSNVGNLMLKKEVIDAVRKGQFNIYAVSTIDEGIEILTGVKAGNWSQENGWEKNSINFLVQERLTDFVQATRADLPTLLEGEL